MQGRMAGFFSDLGAEVAARRKRLRKAVGDGRASLFEFALLTGLMLGIASPTFGPKHFPGVWLAAALPALLVAGYVMIETNRRAQIARGASEAAVAPASDRRALWFLVAVAAAGYLTFVWALLAPAPFELVPDAPPPGALEVTIGP